MACMAQRASRLGLVRRARQMASVMRLGGLCHGRVRRRQFPHVWCRHQ